MMGKLFKRKLSVVILSLFFGFTYGQEEQVAFFPGVFELTEAQRVKADVLHEYANGFAKALLFQNFNEYLLRIEFEVKEGLRKEDVIISTSELEVLREKLQFSMSNKSSQDSVEKVANGRGYLITSTSLHAIAQSRIFSNIFYDDAIVTGIFGPRPPRVRTSFGRALPYFTFAGGMTSSILLTRDKHITKGAANMHFWGSFYGYGHGLLLTAMIREPYRLSGSVTLDNVLVSGTSLLEGWLGYYVAKKHNFSYAHTKAINTGNLWGGFNGIMFYGMIEEVFEWRFSPLGFYGLVGSGVGLFTANRLSQKYPRSPGDITAINMAGIVGLAWGAAFDNAFNADIRTSCVVFFIGTIGGLALAGVSTKNTNFSNLEGLGIGIGTVAGGAFGFGVAYLLGTPYAGYTFGTALGMTAGWITSRYIFSLKETHIKSLGFGKNINWHLNPAAFSLVMSSPERQANLMRQNIRMDLVSLNYTF